MAKSQDRNVLFIIVDDLKPLIGAYDDPVAITPTLDSLSQVSTVFTNAHAQYAKCGPSRASFLTGVNIDALGISSNSNSGEIGDAVTMPEFFLKRGYATAGIGKIFHGKNQHESSWSIPFVEQGLYQYHADFSRPKENEYQSKLKKGETPATERVDVPDAAYRDGAVAMGARGLIKQLAEEDKPFFMAVGFRKPHLPLVAPKKYWDLYDPDCLELSEPQKIPVGLYKHASHDSPELRRYSDMSEHFHSNGILNKAKQLELIHAYYACVSYIDAQIGSILNELNNEDLLNNTVIVVIGDHGWHLGDHGMWTKTTNFEQATRVPMIIYSPDSKLGRRK